MKQVISDDGKIKVTRVSNASNNFMKNVLELEYYYLIEKDEITTVSINEEMRYFSLLEIYYYLSMAGFEVEKNYKYLTKDPIDENTWNGFIVAKRIR